MAASNDSKAKRPDLLTVDELAKALRKKCKPRTLMEHARKGIIPSLKLGKIVLFDLEKVKAKMEEIGTPK